MGGENHYFRHLLWLHGLGFGLEIISPDVILNCFHTGILELHQ